MSPTGSSQLQGIGVGKGQRQSRPTIYDFARCAPIQNIETGDHIVGGAVALPVGAPKDLVPAQGQPQSHERIGLGDMHGLGQRRQLVGHMAIAGANVQHLAQLGIVRQAQVLPKLCRRQYMHAPYASSIWCPGISFSFWQDGQKMAKSKKILLPRKASALTLVVEKKGLSRNSESWSMSMAQRLRWRSAQRCRNSEVPASQSLVMSADCTAAGNLATL